MAIQEREVQALLDALYQEETNLTQARDRLHAAQVEERLASSRYAAIRDLVRERFGGSPYSKHMRQKYPNPSNNNLRGDEYRFIGMNPTDAAVEGIQESSHPVSLEEVAVRLMKGGLRAPNLLRTINAGLMNRSGIHKDRDGAYYYLTELQEIDEGVSEPESEEETSSE